MKKHRFPLPVLTEKCCRNKSLIDMEYDDKYKLSNKSIIFRVNDDRSFYTETIPSTKVDDSLLYCGMLVINDDEYIKIYKDRNVKGYLGYIDIDIIYGDEGIELKGLILVQKHKYFLWNGDINTYYKRDDRKVYTMLKKGHRGWGEVLRDHDESLNLNANISGGAI